MTNIEKIKTTLCSTINAMSEEELFEFISDYEEDGSYFPKNALFSCDKCHNIYGDCGSHTSNVVNYKTCKNRFIDYCMAKCE